MSIVIDNFPFSFIQCTSEYAKKLEAGNQVQEGALYFTLDSKQILLGKQSKLLPMGKSTGIIFANKETDSNNLDSLVKFELLDFDEEYRSNYPQVNDLIFNKDGCFYRVINIQAPYIEADRLTVAGSGGGGGGMGGSKIFLTATEDTLPSDIVVYGKDCYLKFDFQATLNGQSTGNGTLEIIVNDVLKKRKSIPQGINEENISSYLSPGDNAIQLKCFDVYGNYRILQFSREVVKLELDDSNTTNKNELKFFNTRNSTFTYSYIPYGSGKATISGTLRHQGDGTTIRETQEILRFGELQNLTFTNLKYGVYTLDIELKTVVNDEELEPVKVSYWVMCANSSQGDSPLVASYFPFISNETEISQGKPLDFYYMVYDPSISDGTLSVDLKIKYANEGEEYRDYKTDTRQVFPLTQDIWKITDYPVADKVAFLIQYTYKTENGEDMFLQSTPQEIKVIKSSSEITLSTTDLLLSLSANGRSNLEPLNIRDKWSYKNNLNETINTVFQNVNWVNNNYSGTGWLKDNDSNSVLRLHGQSKANINFKPFNYNENGYNLIENGFTIELDFAIRDVNNVSAVAINCMDSEKVGFQVTANKILLRGRSGIEIFSNFNENERIKATFVIESNKKASGGEDLTTKLISIYLNGVLTTSKQYSNETFAQTIPQEIKIGSPDCSIDIYNIRAYRRALPFKEIVNNYIYDIVNPNEKFLAEERNDIYDITNNISYSKLLNNNSIMTIIGDLPTFKGDKRNVKIKYECLFNKNLSFEDTGSIDVQGTSSQYYIRKNWKIKCKSQHLIDQDQIETKVFCMKADYADATGTHNTQHANFIHNLYDNDKKTPAQENDPRCRTTIYGYPVIMFHKETEESDPKFIGKYNFNFDKGSEEVFGFTEDYDVECWEFCNNDSNACNFLGQIPSNWKDDFEPRYLAPFKINEGLENELEISFDRIEELQDQKTLNEMEKEELKTQRDEAIKRFKKMHDWVVSTATFSVVDGQRIPIGTEDEQKARFAKFKNEFETYFDLHYCLIYYVYTFVNLMVDQRSKNMFLTYWGKTGKWQPWLYDNDTCFGINNSGEIKYQYYNEDYLEDELRKLEPETFEGIYVFNGADNILWYNFRHEYATEIQETYRELRKSKLNYNEYINRFINQGSNQWSENIYNEDIDYKYLEPLRYGNYNEEGKWVPKDNSHLPKIQGTGEEYLKYFIGKRLNYCDSKWDAGDYPDDWIELRINTPKNLPENSLAPNYDITVTPFNKMYTCVRYKSNGTKQFWLTDAGESHTFKPINDGIDDGTVTNGQYKDTEVGIYGASNLSSLGDLSGCYCREIKVGKAVKLTELIAGNESDRYYNEQLDTLELGANKLLRVLNLGNCVTLTQDLDLTQSPNIEEIYLFGTNYTSVSLPSSGHITCLHLPESLKVLTLRNQQSLKDFQIKTSDDLPFKNLREVLIDNCSQMGDNYTTQAFAEKLVQDFKSINDIKENEEKEYLYLSFTNINWEFDNADFLLSLIDDEYIGSINPNTNVTVLNTIYITGTCKIKNLTGTQLKKIKENFSSELIINYEELNSNIEFYIGGSSNEEGENSYYYFNYKINDEINQDEYNSFKYLEIIKDSIEEDLENYLPNYFQQIENNKYKCIQDITVVRELNEPIKIFVKSVFNGGTVSDPVKDGSILSPRRFSSPRYNYEFSGWSLIPNGNANTNALKNIEADRNVYAAFIKSEREYNVSFYRAKRNASIDNLEPIYTTIVKYGQDVPYSELPENNKDKYDLSYPGEEEEAKDYIFSKWSPEPKNIVEDTNCISQYSYTAYPSTRLIEKELVEYTSETLETIGDYSFYKCIYLEKINTPNVTYIGEGAFKGCKNLKTLILNSEDICILKSTNAFEDTLIEIGEGIIYVNDNLVNSYQVNENWKNYIIEPISNLEVLGVNE